MISARNKLRPLTFPKSDGRKKKRGELTVCRLVEIGYILIDECVLVWFCRIMYRHLPSLKERIVKSRATLQQSSSKCYTPFRSGPRKLWDDESMQRAVTAVEKQGESLRHASGKYGIPRSTLHDHISGKVEHGSKPGRGSYLSPEEEEELVSFLIKCARIGYPHTRKQLMALVQAIAKGKGIETTISDGWWERFKQRHSNITLRIAAPLSFARAMASDRFIE